MMQATKRQGRSKSAEMASAFYEAPTSFLVDYQLSSAVRAKVVVLQTAFSSLLFQ
jgi:hypothetical protein